MSTAEHNQSCDTGDSCGGGAPQRGREYRARAKKGSGGDSNAEPAVVGRNGPITKDEFLDFVSGNFKTRLSRGAQLRKGDTALVAVSGGPSSRALVHLLANAVTGGSAGRKMLISLSLLHIDDSALEQNSANQQLSRTEQIRALFASEPFGDVRVVALEDVLFAAPPSQQTAASTSEPESSESPSAADRLRAYVNSFRTASSREDVVRLLIRRAIVEYAAANGFSKVVLGCTASHLAMRVVSDVAKGRAYSLPLQLTAIDSHYQCSLLQPSRNDSGADSDGDSVSDAVSDGPLLLKPMRDLLSKEVALYLHYNGLSHSILQDSSALTPPKTSIDQLTHEFLTTLQTGYPSTIHTILRTTEKLTTPLPPRNLSPLFCPLCNDALTKSEALEAVRHVTKEQQPTNPDSSDSTNQSLFCNLRPADESQSPAQSRWVFCCYGCRRMLNEQRQPPATLPANDGDRHNNDDDDYSLHDVVPAHMTAAIRSSNRLLSRSEIRAEIDEFLLSE